MPLPASSARHGFAATVLVIEAGVTATPPDSDAPGCAAGAVVCWVGVGEAAVDEPALVLPEGRGGVAAAATAGRAGLESDAISPACVPMAS